MDWLYISELKALIEEYEKNLSIKYIGFLD